MGKTNSATTLATETNSILKEKGIYYFKLNPEYFLHRGIGEDEQKSCGLLGTEIDSNFHFLSGYDIKSVEVKDGKLIIKRVNEESFEPLVVDIAQEFGNAEFEFDPESGNLNIFYPDGTSAQTGGFITDSSFKAVTDGTLVGLGNKNSIMGISPTEKTGYYAPVSAVVEGRLDKAIENGVVGDVSCGQRFITKEELFKHGTLYPYSSVEKIQSALTNTGSAWRVPTEEDWNAMLNSLEPEGSKDHGSNGRNPREGEVAGEAIKADREWSRPGANVGGFDALPTGYYVEGGRGLTDKGSTAGFWSFNDNDDNKDAIVKRLEENFDGVNNDGYRKNGAQWFSVRLVKDYTPGCVREYEDILGQNLPTGVLPCEPTRVWTLANLYAADDEIPGYEIEEDAPEYGYFINEVIDGKGNVLKKKMKEGDKVTVLSEDYHEFMVKDGELVDVFDETENAISDAAAEINSNLSELSASTIAFSAGVATALSELSESADSAIAELKEELEAVDEEIKENISGLTEHVDSQIAEVKSGITEAVKAEEDRAIEKENELQGLISGNTSAIESASTIISSNSSRITSVESEIARIDSDIDAVEASVETAKSELNSTISELSASTAANLPRYGEYELSQDGVEVPSEDGTKSIKVSVSDEFFSFGTVLQGDENIDG